MRQHRPAQATPVTCGQRSPGLSPASSVSSNHTFACSDIRPWPAFEARRRAGPTPDGAGLPAEPELTSSEQGDPDEPTSACRPGRAGLRGPAGHGAGRQPRAQPGRHLRQLPWHQRRRPRRHESAGRRQGRYADRDDERLQGGDPAGDASCTRSPRATPTSRSSSSPATSLPSSPGSEERQDELRSTHRPVPPPPAGCRLRDLRPGAGGLRQRTEQRPFDRPRRHRRRRLRRQHRRALPQDVGRQRRRHAGRAQPQLHLVPDLQPGHRRPQADGRHHARLRRPQGAGREGGAGRRHRHRRGGQEGAPGRRRRTGLRPADRFAGHRLHDRRHRRPGLGAGHRPGHAQLEGRAADRGAAQAARGHARWRRVRDIHPQGALPLPARALRARLHGGQLFQGRQAAAPRCWCWTPTPRSRARRGCSRRPSRTTTPASSNTAPTTS